MRSALFSVLVAMGALGACRTTVDDSPIGVDQGRPIVLDAQRMWRVMDGERVVGVVVRFGAPHDAEDPTRHYFSVRNELQQELGTIDGHGRAWRFEPHRPTPRFVGTGAVLDGARAILGCAPSATLIEAPLVRG